MGASQATGEAASAVGIDLGDDSSQYQCCKLTYNQRLIGFASCFGIGLLFSLLSMFFIFYDIISFAGFYSLGNLFSIGSVFFLMGACVCVHTRNTHVHVVLESRAVLSLRAHVTLNSRVCLYSCLCAELTSIRHDAHNRELILLLLLLLLLCGGIRGVVHTRISTLCTYVQDRERRRRGTFVHGRACDTGKEENGSA